MILRSTIVNVFVSCCASAFLMEILMVKDPSSVNLVTFLQFLFIALQGFIFTSKFGTARPKIPLHRYAVLVVLFFITSVANNYVYALHVPSTLHMIIRSASSPASMIVYWMVKKQHPKLAKIIGSILITIGVAVAMYGGATIAEQNKGEFVYWCIGVAILLTTLFLGAFMGLQQEMMFASYGKHPNEVCITISVVLLNFVPFVDPLLDHLKAYEPVYLFQMLFYTNVLSLPLFLGMYPQLRDKSFECPLQIWFFIALSIISQFYCTHSVHQLATKESSMTVTFILTLRKFVSLLISSLIFKNNLTILHFIGTVFVAIGTYVYFDFFARKQQQPVDWKKSR